MKIKEWFKKFRLSVSNQKSDNTVTETGNWLADKADVIDCFSLLYNRKTNEIAVNINITREGVETMDSIMCRCLDARSNIRNFILGSVYHTALHDETMREEVWNLLKQIEHCYEDE